MNKLPVFKEFVQDVQKINPNFTLEALNKIYAWLKELEAENENENFSYDPYYVYSEYIEGTLSDLQENTFGSSELPDDEFYIFLVNNTNFKKLPNGNYVMEKIYI